MTKMQLSVKNVEKELFRQLKADAVKEGVQVGDALNLAIKLYLDRKRKKPKVSFLDLKPQNWGKGSERTSEQTDEILYGEEG
ncbi:MAG TPA: hypothetical protein VJJ75_00405 [Candidatus Nanoarchaeia archaeon]|nr:hypothetical protein [Candidatus Nanoarchaeia archaeon]